MSKRLVTAKHLYGSGTGEVPVMRPVDHIAFLSDEDPFEVTRKIREANPGNPVRL